jgi:hypothetical protein
MNRTSRPDKKWGGFIPPIPIGICAVVNDRTYNNIQIRLICYKANTSAEMPTEHDNLTSTLINTFGFNIRNYKHFQMAFSPSAISDLFVLAFPKSVAACLP